MTLESEDSYVQKVPQFICLQISISTYLVDLFVFINLDYLSQKFVS